MVVSVRRLAVVVAAGACLSAAAAASTPVQPTATIHVGVRTGFSVAGAGSIWITDRGSDRLVRVDLRRNRVAKRIAVGSEPFGVAYGARSVWVVHHLDDRLYRIDPRTNRVIRKIRVGFGSYGVAVGAGSVWVTNAFDGRLRRVSVRRNRVVKTFKLGGELDGVTYAFGSIWVAGFGRSFVARVDPRANRVTSRHAIPKPDWATAAAGALWVSSESGGVYRLDPTAGVVARVPVGANPLASAVVGGELWVPDIDDAAVSVIDPARSAVVRTLDVAPSPISIVSAGGSAWVTHESGVLWRLATS